MTDYGHSCGKDQDCTLPNIHCAYPNCYKGKQQATQTTDADIDRAIQSVLREVLNTKWHPVPVYDEQREIYRAIYRAVFAAGVEMAASVCEKEAANWQSASVMGKSMSANAAKGCAAVIRKLKDSK